MLGLRRARPYRKSFRGLVGVVVLPFSAPSRSVMTECRETDHHSVVLVQQISGQHDIAPRLRHFSAFVGKQGGVEPDPDIGAVPHAPILRSLALVVREDEVGSAAVDVHSRTTVFAGHHGAADVPTGTTTAERRVVLRLAGTG